MNLITPQIKDKILSDLISLDDSFIDIEFDSICMQYEISSNQFEMVIKQFIEMGLFENKGGCIGGNILLSPTMKAYDFLSHGGFYAQEEILKANINKLGLELELLSKELEPNFIEKANNISSIVNNIISFLNLTKIL